MQSVSPEMVRYTTVSSASRRTVDLRFSGMSLMKYRKSEGTRTEPWGD